MGRYLQETIVGMVLVQYDERRSETCSSSAVITQPDGSSMVAQPLGTGAGADAPDTTGEKGSGVNEAEIVIEERGGGCAWRNDDDERIGRAIGAGDVVTLDSADPF
jgi:hypothetical protein